MRSRACLYRHTCLRRQHNHLYRLHKRCIGGGEPRTYHVQGSTSGDAIVRQYAAKAGTSISLSDIISYTGTTDEKMREFGKYIWNEIPIRISHRVVELSSLPYNLSNAESIRELRDLYTHSFHLFRMLEPPDSDEAEQRFIAQMKSHFDQLKSAVPLIANGLTQCIADNPAQAPLIQECLFLNGFLDRFNAARLGTRLLTGQYITCKEQQERARNGKPLRSNILGLIDFECNPKVILENAIDDATRLSEATYGKCPDVNIKIKDKDMRFAYVPSDLHYIFFELMKNSMRAVCEHLEHATADELPAIECVVVASRQSDDVTIKISDQGGGISRENMQKIWYYSFSTIVPEARPSVTKSTTDVSGSSRDNKAPMAGFGYGLPLSRLYSRYFGGDLEVISMDGFGTDAFVYLNWLKPDDTRKLTAKDALDSHLSGL